MLLSMFFIIVHIIIIIGDVPLRTMHIINIINIIDLHLMIKYKYNADSPVCVVFALYTAALASLNAKPITFFAVPLLSTLISNLSNLSLIKGKQI